MLEPVPDGPELPAGPFDLPIDRNALPIPKARVWPPGDGLPPYEVQIYGADIISYEETAAKHGWPTDLQKAGARGTFYLAWRASLREHKTDLTWEQFKTTTRFVQDVPGPDVASPTGPGPVPG
jgi:hypothetical protein